MLHVDGARLRQDMHGLAAYGAAVGGGFSRLYLTDQDLAARAWLIHQFERAGLRVRTDDAWNIFGRWDGTADLPAILTGSHIDTVIQGGGFDGVLGVLGALEAIRSLREAGYRPKRAIELVCFGGEEPVRFGKGMLGSRVLAGRLGPEDAERLLDLDGVPLAQALRDAGRDPGRLGAAKLEPAAYATFVELHIEQGPVLEEAQMPLGVVDVIAGSALAHVSVEGVTAHAGAMPMRLRRDALAAASQMVLAIEEETRKAVGGSATGTVGSLRPHPGANNVIAGKVDFEVDLRDRDQRIKAQLTARVRERVEAIAAERGVHAHWEQRSDDLPTPTDPRVRALLADTCRDHGEALEMPSGPFHDAAQIASIMPMGMVFVPSRGGLSHCPEEWTDLEHCVMGVAVLAKALERLSE